MFGKLSNEINGELEIAKDQKDSQNIYLGELDYEALMSCVDGELRYQPLSPYACLLYTSTGRRSCSAMKPAAENSTFSVDS